MAIFFLSNLAGFAYEPGRQRTLGKVRPWPAIQLPNVIPWAKGRSLEKFTTEVCRRM